MRTQSEVNISQSYQDRIYQVYENALKTASARTKLKSELLTELETNITTFELTINKIIGDRTPKDITVNSIKFSLGMFWMTSCCGNGSTLRAALIKAKTEVDEIKKEYALYQQRLIIKKLESNNSFWNLEELRTRIDNNWSATIKQDLMYLIDFKQAEFLFIKHILPYQINCRGAIFVIEDVLFQLCKTNGDNLNDRIETSKSNLQEFLAQIQTFKFHQSLKYKNVAAIFIEICKEWFQIIATITFRNRVLDSTQGIFQIKEVKDFWEKLGDALRPTYNEHLQLLNDMCRKDNGFAFLKLMMEKINNYEKMPNPTPSDDLFAYKMRQYLFWISHFPADKEMVPIDVSMLNKFTKKLQPLYSSLKQPEEKTPPLMTCISCSIVAKS